MNDSLPTRLADALERARTLARKQVLKSAQIRRADRELLTQRGYLREIVKGWYLLSRPMDKDGESTAWYGAFWDFLSVYLEDRFGADYCLSATSSIAVHTGANIIPRQVIALTARGGTMQLSLPHNTSVLVYQDSKNLPRTTEVVQGVRTMPLAAALCRMPPVFFQSQPLDAEIALRGVKSTDGLIRAILETESPAVAARFIGAYQFLGDLERASEITSVLQAAGMVVQPENLFANPAPIITSPKRLPSPYAARIEALFSTLRQPVLEVFKDLPPRPVAQPESYLEQLETVYEHDAYNSLSIEGYRVTPELIETIRAGVWNPEGNPQDRQQVEAMAAKGYQEAFRRVKLGVTSVLQGRPAGSIFRQDYQDWYRGLFSASVQAGLLESHHLAGHRNAPVYIRSSRHVPPPAEAVNDAMTTLLDLLAKEESPIIRAVLGHWLFGFIHPFMDGNGRMARFLMNLMMASGGYPWTIVRTARRKEYLDALEAASAEQNILPFAQFIRQEMSVDWSKVPTFTAARPVKT
ncbi:MAG: Fic family protein [Verrucomicrobiota bacterium]